MSNIQFVWFKHITDCSKHWSAINGQLHLFQIFYFIADFCITKMIN